jgi:hypothetical protein
VYYLLRTVPVAELTLMRRIDELHINHPYAGGRGLRDRFQREGLSVGRKHVRILMWRMGIEALYRRPGASKRHPGYTIYPYLLGHLAIDRANRVWALDSTDLPIAHGFVYLTAVIYWASRKILANRVAVTLEVCHADYVFTLRGRPIRAMGNSAWNAARVRVGLPHVRVHDWKHTFGRRLSVAGMSFKDRQDFLRHRSGRGTTHLGVRIRFVHPQCSEFAGTNLARPEGFEPPTP